ncbi:hypothetical protein SPRG_04127 [Saprolegnia parasitica CBS 223.65]|uniref:SAM-dependent MTase RsmB/NOP-type domain-containing protein n=1 Tax=Saprolegnia parasitica (strain CBS 223.65) TaxID=695850 RepID=A0A067CJL4_SAPPC|nr:hypothetical protein SPRG_04127 [Saprolegnia parasitica CBS 223.65]KDO30939.1 hypothetical protein SPRG_04127 [Saprolegnia parasitica CBS 223.65]|eukprot:XP_012198123.1 hypothetical protein SPRG_04127 [Saprolegnia parasitica CBS 223.65]
MSTLYAEAAGVLEGLFRHSGGLKSLTYADKIKSKRNCFALVCQTLRYKPLLDQLIAAVPELTKIIKKSPKASGKAAPKKARPTTSQQALYYIAIYDLMFGKDKKIQGGGFVKKQVLAQHNALKQALVRLKVKAKVKTDEELLPEENRMSESQRLPRYARINTLRVTEPIDSIPAIRAALKLPEDLSFDIDAHVGDLIVFPPGTELHTHESVVSGRLILQDKASCFSAYVLQGERGHDDLGDVIDACAAPGNKTSHAAMLVARKASSRPLRVFAFDRSATRLDLLKRRMKGAAADKIVEPCLQSFLDVNVNDAKYANVTSILLDPSCSGSGMSNRLDHLLELATMKQGFAADDEYEASNGEAGESANEVQARLQALADFQLEALQKHFQNEDVVMAALKASRAAGTPFHLVKALPTWPRRGVVVDGLNADQADCLVRANGLEDGTNGFFVAYFERSDGSSSKRKREKTDAQRERKKRKRQAIQDRKAAATAQDDAA